jgi:hypothetical protein
MADFIEEVFYTVNATIDTANCAVTALRKWEEEIHE